MALSSRRKWFEIIDNQRNFVENKYNFVDSAVSVDSLTHQVGTRRNNNVIITSKRRRDVVLAL